MCMACTMDQPLCNYCGEECYGSCADPDTCGSCWCDKHFDYDVDDNGEALEDCLDSGCTCMCHEDLYEDLDTRVEAGVFVYGETCGPPYERKGIFPFLTLPREIRDKIYGYAMLQHGHQRYTQSHRGTIHTALLQTCRQINKEARHFPLTINTLCFDGPVSALYFFAYRLPSTVSNFAKAIHIEYPVHAPEYEICNLLVRELAKMEITHLGLTIYGPLRKDHIVGHNCFTTRWKPLTSLKSIDLQLGSAFVTEADRLECLEYVKKQLIKVHRPSEKVTMKAKRVASDDALHPKEGKKPAKMAKRNIGETKRSNHSPLSSDTNTKTNTKKVSPFNAEARLEAQLTTEYTQLKAYATSLDLSLVSIRLENARKAAADANLQKFQPLARGIWNTLENHYSAIHSARQRLLGSNVAANVQPLAGKLTLARESANTGSK